MSEIVNTPIEMMLKRNLAISMFMYDSGAKNKAKKGEFGA
jgi:hypothetical protein